MIIWNHFTVASGNWIWEPYGETFADGSPKSPHTHHMHVSIHATKAAEDDVADWWDLENMDISAFSFRNPLTMI